MNSFVLQRFKCDSELFLSTDQKINISDPTTYTHMFKKEDIETRVFQHV